MKSLSQNAYFFADLHLNERPDGAARLASVCEALDALIAKRPVYACFLGDTLDFSCGYAGLRPAAFFDRIEKLVLQGSQVVFLTGNHDPALSPDVLRLGCQIWDPGIYTFGKYKIYLSHGDLDIVQGKRKVICQLARNSQILRLVRLLPERFVTALTDLYGQRPQKTRRPFVRFQTLELCRALQNRLRGQADFILCGHLHCAIELSGVGDLPSLKVLGPWANDANSQPYCLHLEGGEG